MKNKYSKIFLLSLGLLSVASAPQVLAEEQESSSSISIATSTSSTLSETAIEQTMPVNSQTSSDVATESSTVASSEVSSEVEEASTSSSEEATTPSTVTNELGTFVMPSGRSDLDSVSADQKRLLRSIPAGGANLPSKSFVDVSSHNGAISVANYQKMKTYGVKGVVVKLTEGTSYLNPYAASQIANARNAGLKVSAYHFARYTNTSTARSEANYFVKVAKSFGLGTDTVMVNDLEVNGNSQATNSANAFASQVKQLGYSKVRHYSSLSWFTSGTLNPNSLGYKNIWVAAYPYTPTKNLYTNYNSWQWASDLVFPGINGYYDISADYSGDFVSANTSAPSGSTAMYRVYNPNTGEHHYTVNSYEKDNLTSKGWRYEGVAWNAPTSGTPVYRMYNPNRGGDHHYTLNTNEVAMLKAKGWRYEGVAWYSGGSKKLLRLYNPNANSGSHHYTLNQNEKNNLVKKGWRYEGVSWYGR